MRERLGLKRKLFPQLEREFWSSAKGRRTFLKINQFLISKERPCRAWMLDQMPWLRNVTIKAKNTRVPPPHPLEPCWDSYKTAVSLPVFTESSCIHSFLLYEAHKSLLQQLKFILPFLGSLKKNVVLCFVSSLGSLLLFGEFSHVKVSNLLSGKSLGSSLISLVLLSLCLYWQYQSLPLPQPPYLLRKGKCNQNVRLSLLRIRKHDVYSLYLKVVCDDGGDTFDIVLLA